MKYFLLFFLFFIACFNSYPQKELYETISNIHYYNDSINKSNDYIDERCVLDLYYPAETKIFPTVVWFHGGGLTGGNKEIPSTLKKKGFAVVGVNYRLSPKVKSPSYVEDAAAAVAWVFNNISNYGGDTSLIFVAGYSAGGYLTEMIGLDKKYLAKYNVDANRIAGLVSLSGQAITHFTVGSERNIPGTQPIIDDMAPLYYVRNDAAPLILITGDSDLEMLGRYEENAYLRRMMIVAGHTKTKLFKLDGYDHGITEAAYPIMIKEINRIIGEKKKN